MLVSTMIPSVSALFKVLRGEQEDDQFVIEWRFEERHPPPPVRIPSDPGEEQYRSRYVTSSAGRHKPQPGLFRLRNAATKQSDQRQMRR